MSLISIAFVFILAWWILLFTVLPIDIQSDPENKFGSGAPLNTGLGKKVLATTILAILATTMIYFIITQGWIPV